jgi:hypothetical protein
MNKKINLIEQILRCDYHSGSIEKGSLKNQHFILWSEGKKHSDLVPDSELMREIKNSPAFNFVKDDGAVILNIKLGLDESNFIADMLKNKKDVDGYDLFSLDWDDDRDFRSQKQIIYDRLVFELESSAFHLRQSKFDFNLSSDSELEEASLIINKAIKLAKKAKQILN